MNIHSRRNGPGFNWNSAQISTILGDVRYVQGKLLGRMDGLSFNLQREAVLEILTLDGVKNGEIEGQVFDHDQVRSSIAHRLGIELTVQTRSTTEVEGIVRMMLDITQDFTAPLTKDRLLSWHDSLFRPGSTELRSAASDWRQRDKDPMQDVSGATDNPPSGEARQRIRFQAPDSTLVAAEIQQFLSWVDSSLEIDDVLKAAIAQLWFITIHPFDAGNRWIARAITDMQLARSDKSSQRFYSMSAQILKEREEYDHILERTQKGSLDITPWLMWFLECLKKAILSSEVILATVISKSRFWEDHRETLVNERQQKMIHEIIDGFTGELSTSKWAERCSCSTDTALRDIQDLEKKGVLIKEAGRGRSTSYTLSMH